MWITALQQRERMAADMQFLKTQVASFLVGRAQTHSSSRPSRVWTEAFRLFSGRLAHPRQITRVWKWVGHHSGLLWIEQPDRHHASLKHTIGHWNQFHLQDVGHCLPGYPHETFSSSCLPDHHFFRMHHLHVSKEHPLAIRDPGSFFARRHYLPVSGRSDKQRICVFVDLHLLAQFQACWKRKRFWCRLVCSRSLQERWNHNCQLRESIRAPHHPARALT
jgi:hypothetical protein